MLQSWLIPLRLKGLHSVKHEIVGRLVLECTKAGYYLQDVPLERYQGVSDLIEGTSMRRLNLITAVERRHSLGGTGFDQVKWPNQRSSKVLKNKSLRPLTISVLGFCYL